MWFGEKKKENTGRVFFQFEGTNIKFHLMAIVKARHCVESKVAKNLTLLFQNNAITIHAIKIVL